MEPEQWLTMQSVEHQCKAGKCPLCPLYHPPLPSPSLPPPPYSLHPPTLPPPLLYNVSVRELCIHLLNKHMALQMLRGSVYVNAHAKGAGNILVAGCSWEVVASTSFTGAPWIKGRF